MKLVSNCICLSDQVTTFIQLSAREVCFRDLLSALVFIIVFPSDAHLALLGFLWIINMQIWVARYEKFKNKYYITK